MIALSEGLGSDDVAPLSWRARLGNVWAPFKTLLPMYSREERWQFINAIIARILEALEVEAYTNGSATFEFGNLIRVTLSAENSSLIEDRQDGYSWSSINQKDGFSLSNDLLRPGVPETEEMLDDQHAEFLISEDGRLNQEIGYYLICVAEQIEALKGYSKVWIWVNPTPDAGDEFGEAIEGVIFRADPWQFKLTVKTEKGIFAMLPGELFLTKEAAEDGKVSILSDTIESDHP